MEVPGGSKAEPAAAAPGGAPSTTGGVKKTKKAPQGTHNKINTKKF